MKNKSLKLRKHALKRKDKFTIKRWVLRTTLLLSMNSFLYTPLKEGLLYYKQDKECEQKVEQKNALQDKILLSQPLPILLYHDISETTEERFRLPVQKFEAQLKYLKKNNFTTVTLASLLKESAPKNAVVLTFDDISKNFFSRVYPLLIKYKMRATAFVIVNDVTSNESAKKLTWRELIEMNKSGLIDIESHTMNHINLVKCNEKKVAYELMMSKHILETVLDKEISLIAWPFGKHNNIVDKIGREKGYLGFVNCDSSIVGNPTINLANIGRYEVNGKWNQKEFENILKKLKGSKRLEPTYEPLLEEVKIN